MDIYIHTGNAITGDVGPTLGPFEFVQVTYATVRVSPDGDEVAWLDSEGTWTLMGDGSAWTDLTVSPDDGKRVPA